MRFLAAFLAVAGFLASPVIAATVDISGTQGEYYFMTQGVRPDSATRGTDLDGMRVTATFLDGSVESNIWQRYDPWTNGGIDGIDFDISFGWENFDLSTAKTMTSLLFEADLGNSLFDIGSGNSPIAPYPSVDTPGTRVGYPFRIYGTDTQIGTIRVTYTNVVSFVGEDAAGDAYTDMLLDFTGLTDGGLTGTLAFQTDLDTLAAPGDLRVMPVPVPPALPLLLSCLGLLGFTSVRRKQQA